MRTCHDWCPRGKKQEECGRRVAQLGELYDRPTLAAFVTPHHRERNRQGRVAATRPARGTEFLDTPGSGSASPRRALAVALLLLFSALLSVKTMSYMIAIWLLAVLAIARTVIRLTRAAPCPVGIALFIAVVLSAAEGLGRAAHARLAAEHVSDYESYTAQIASCVPAGSRVLGLQHYWLGLRQFEFRTWLLPFNLSRRGWYHEPLTLAQALRRVAPSAVLIDRYIATLLEENGSPGRPLYQDAR